MTNDETSAGRDPAALLLAEVKGAFRAQRELGEGALRQLAPEDWHATLDEEANSIAVIVRHLDGNMRSRWNDFLTSDGEKPSRDRDGEFEPTEATPDELWALWHRGWDAVFAALEELGADDLTRLVTIRGRPLTVAGAAVRQLTHYAQHVGQIVLLAKRLRGDAWRTLSIPKRRG